MSDQPTTGGPVNDGFRVEYDDDFDCWDVRDTSPSQTRVATFFASQLPDAEARARSLAADLNDAINKAKGEPK